MQKKKLNYIFYDPNKRDITASFLFDLFVEVNTAKVNRIISEAVREKTVLFTEQSGQALQPETGLQI